MTNNAATYRINAWRHETNAVKSEIRAERMRAVGNTKAESAALRRASAHHMLAAEELMVLAALFANTSSDAAWADAILDKAARNLNDAYSLDAGASVSP
jgi:hypothetical protein